VRIARQHSGFEPTDKVLVSISIHDGNAVEDVVCVEASFPLADGQDLHDPVVLADKRVLVVEPTRTNARVQSAAIKRFGATVEAALEHAQAADRMRSAHKSGRPFDALYIDDSTAGADELVDAARVDASLGYPCSIVATAKEHVSSWVARGAHVALVKPVLPLELCDVLRDVAPHEAAESDGPHGCRDSPSMVRRRVAQGADPASQQRVDLAAVLAAVALGPLRQRE